jgi:hypothetical protein
MGLLDLLGQKPADFDIRTASQILFVGDKSTIEQSWLILYDSSEYFEVYSGDDIKKLVKDQKMVGTVVPVHLIQRMLAMLLDSYAVLSNPHASMQDRLKVSQWINDELVPLRLL